MIRDKKVKRLFSNTIMLYILQISGYLFPLITFPYLTRVLGANNYGIVIFTNAIILYFQMFVDFGFLLSATKECSINSNNKKKLGEIIGAVIQAKTILSIIGFIVLIFLTRNVEVFKEKEIFILLSYLPVFTSIYITDYLFRGLEIMKVITYRTIISKCIYMILIFILVKSDTGYYLIPIIATLSNVFIIIWNYIYIKKNLKIRIKIVSINKVISQLKDSSMFFVSRIASTIYTSSNTIVLGNFYSNVELGEYGAANTLISSARSLLSPIADSIYPYMIKEKNYKLTKRIMAILMPVIILGTIGLYYLSDFIILTISGEDYLNAVPMFKAMLPLIIVTLPTYLLGYPILGAMGKMKEANLSVLYSSIFHVFGIIFLYINSAITVISIIRLTCITEYLVLLIRIYYVTRGFKENEKNII